MATLAALNAAHNEITAQMTILVHQRSLIMELRRTIARGPLGEGRWVRPQPWSWLREGPRAEGGAGSSEQHGDGEDRQGVQEGSDAEGGAATSEHHGDGEDRQGVQEGPDAEGGAGTFEQHGESFDEIARQLAQAQEMLADNLQEMRDRDRTIRELRSRIPPEQQHWRT